MHSRAKEMGRLTVYSEVHKDAYMLIDTGIGYLSDLSMHSLRNKTFRGPCIQRQFRANCHS